MENYGYTCKSKKIAETLERCMIALQNDTVISIRREHGLTLFYNLGDSADEEQNMTNILHNSMRSAFKNDTWFISYFPMHEAFDTLLDNSPPILKTDSVTGDACRIASERLKTYLFSLVGDEYRSQSDNEHFHPVLADNGSVIIGAVDNKALLEYVFRLEESVRMAASVLRERQRIIDCAGERLERAVSEHRIAENGGDYLGFK